jgi:hypothetical protein
LQDYAEAVRLDPSDKTAASKHDEIALEIERLGSLNYQKNLPSFNCATAKRPMEKAICADPGLAQLDRNINDGRVGADPAAARLHRQAQCLVRPPWLRSASGNAGQSGQTADDRVTLSLSSRGLHLSLWVR